MVSPPIFEAGPSFAFWSQRGEVWDAPQEWQTGFIEVEGVRDVWEQCRLWRNDAEMPLGLQRVGGKVRVVAMWPLSGPGNYHLRLQSPSIDIPQTVMVQPCKITQQGFTDLLWHLETRLPASIAIGLQRCGGLAGIEIIPARETTDNEELLRLRRAVYGDAALTGLAALLPLVACDPHRVLHTVEPWVRRDQARRPHAARLAHALTRGGNLDNDHLPLYVFDARSTPTFDVYENRVLQAFVTLVDLRLRRLQDVARVATIRDECQTLLRDLATARRRASFLDTVVGPSLPPTQPTMVLLKRPPYRAALQGYLRLYRSVQVRLDDAALDAPLENLPSLYQKWGTMEVIDALVAAAADAGFRVEQHRLLQRDRDGFFVRLLPDGSPALVLTHPISKVRLSLTPERNFTRSVGLHSISYHQRPDVTVEIAAPGTTPRLYLFDPKYKFNSDKGNAGAAGRARKEDIDKMHAYRDAIRDGDDQRVVKYAAILYPGRTRRFGNEVAALCARPDHADDLHGTLLALFQGILT